MTLFDRYIAVDWSANNRPKSGKDSIWIAERAADGSVVSLNPPTRHAAMQHLIGRLEESLAAGSRTLVGLDFPFGYPKGTALRLAGASHWSRLWETISDATEDAPDNKSNRFAVASAFNLLLGEGGPRFWGCPISAATDSLRTHKHGASFEQIAEFRIVETVARGAKSTWQLFYNGSVGSQCLLGLAHLQMLRQHSSLDGKVAVWPFETEFERHLDAPVILAEIYPSLDGHDPRILPKDRAQVEAQVRRFAMLDSAGLLSRALSLPDAFDTQRDHLLTEEGWIVGAGHPGLLP